MAELQPSATIARPLRLPLLLAAALGFCLLYLVAPLITFDVDVFDLPDDIVHDIAHVVIYGGLAMVMAQGLGGRLVLAALLTAALSAGEEWHQIGMQYRTASVGDWLLDLAGIAVGLALLRLWRTYALRQTRSERLLVIRGKRGIFGVITGSGVLPDEPQDHFPDAADHAGLLAGQRPGLRFTRRRSELQDQRG